MARAYETVLVAVHRQAVPIQDARRISVPAIVLRLIERAIRTLVRQVNNDVSKIARVDVAKLAGSETIVRQFRKRNVDLIRTIAAEHLRKVDRVLSRSGALHHEALARQLERTLEVSRSRARFWAIDQTLKLNADVTETQHERLGVEEYVWRTSQDGDVREYHRRLNGRRFRYDDPPVVSKDGRRENPGKDYRCRCHADPVLPD